MANGFLSTHIGRLRLAGIVEGISFLLLLFIAMPLKYFAGIPEAVKVTGWIHGILFILYILAMLVVRHFNRWPFRRTFTAVVASLLPFGTFVFDKQLKKEAASHKS